MRRVLDTIAILPFGYHVEYPSISYDLDGDKYFISINVTKYDNPNLERRGAERNTQKLIETFQNGVDLLNYAP